MSSACSAIFVQKPPSDPSQPVSCTRSRAAPIVDTLVPVWPAVAGVIEVGEEGSKGNYAFATLVGVGVVGVIALFATSAWWGFTTTSRCRERLDAVVAEGGAR